MANNFVINPATRGTDNSKSMEQVACYPIDTNGDDITSDNPLPVELPPCICDENSSSTPLSADETFTGDAVLTNGYGIIYVNVYSDVASAIDGLHVEYSYDGLDWHPGETYTILAGSTKFFTPPKQARYYRLTYTNNGDDQTEFHIHALLSKTPLKWSSHNIDDPIKDEDDAELVKAVITGKRVDGQYDNANLTNGNNLKTSVEEFEEAISTNNKTQLKTTLYDEGGVPAEVDNSTNTIQVIPYEHHEIHSGSHYIYSDRISLGNAATQDYLVTTPNTTSWGHFIYKVSGSAGCNFTIYEGGDRVGTTLQTVFNSNRNSSNTATITVHKGQSGGTTDGTPILYNGFGSGTAGGNSGTAQRENEFVLKQNTKYIVRITNRATTANTVTVELIWYEHADKN